MDKYDNIEDFMRYIKLPQEAAKKILDYQMTEAEYKSWKNLFWIDRTNFFEKLEGAKDTKFKTLYLYIRFGIEMKPVFLENGISEQIYYDTFYDLTIWCKWYKKYYGEYGMTEAKWYERLFELKVFRLGRLEFEKIVLDKDIRYSKGIIKAGEKAIGVHVPEGNRLLEKECDRSFQMAENFFSEEYKIYTCASWLISPALEELLDGESNILKFKSRFEILDITYEFPLAEQRVFGIVKENKSEYPENTRLQRKMKEFYLQGRKVGIAFGVKERSV